MERTYAIDSLDCETSFLKQTYYAQSREESQMSLVKNSKFFVLPLSTNYQLPNRWEVSNVRYRCDYATSTTKERTRECQGGGRMRHVLENIIENNAIKIARREIQLRAEIPVKNLVKIFLRFRNRSRVAFDSPHFTACSLPQAGSEASR